MVFLLVLLVTSSVVCMWSVRRSMKGEGLWDMPTAALSALVALPTLLVVLVRLFGWGSFALAGAIATAAGVTFGYRGKHRAAARCLASACALLVIASAVWGAYRQLVPHRLSQEDEKLITPQTIPLQASLECVAQLLESQGRVRLAVVAPDWLSGNLAMQEAVARVLAPAGTARVSVDAWAFPRGTFTTRELHETVHANRQCNVLLLLTELPNDRRPEDIWKGYRGKRPKIAMVAEAPTLPSAARSALNRDVVKWVVLSPPPDGVEPEDAGAPIILSKPNVDALLQTRD